MPKAAVLLSSAAAALVAAAVLAVRNRVHRAATGLS